MVSSADKRYKLYTPLIQKENAMNSTEIQVEVGKSAPAAVVAKPVATAPASAPVSAVKPAVKRAIKPAAKTVVKPAKVASPAQPVAAAKPAAAVKPAATAKAAAKPASKAAAKPAVKKEVKVKKAKLLRDSFTIPKPEYGVLEDLKLRAAKLAQPVKKSELLRAGIKALAAMADAALLAALKAVPAIKTGRPKN
jgi:hypothetical protein